ncbi:hypothetical protein C8E87_0785 [Paractinoplanes brasiliensis]|uniref:Uncharacterized protein n=1 Tax=Paractinoplanes brasiliensis TaxID=52695 RepID=A0A4V3C7C8_9ACTN|nr:hypothetical protein C8E87_0785 [Actinoplanes brasiliensis]
MPTTRRARPRMRRGPLPLRLLRATLPRRGSEVLLRVAVPRRGLRAPMRRVLRSSGRRRDVLLLPRNDHRLRDRRLVHRARRPRLRPFRRLRPDLLIGRTGRLHRRRPFPGRHSPKHSRRRFVRRGSAVPLRCSRPGSLRRYRPRSLSCSCPGSLCCSCPGSVCRSCPGSLRRSRPGSLRRSCPGSLCCSCPGSLRRSCPGSLRRPRPGLGGLRPRRACLDPGELGWRGARTITGHRQPWRARQEAGRLPLRPPYIRARDAPVEARWLFRRRSATEPERRRRLTPYGGRLLTWPQIGPRPGNRRMIVAQRRRPQLGHPRERLARLMPIAQLLGHRPDLVRDLQHQRIGVPQPPLPSRVRLLQHPPRTRRVIHPLQQNPQLVRGAKNIGIILRKVDFPQFDSLLQQRLRPRNIPRRGQGSGALPGRIKGRGLRHARHAARNHPPPPSRSHHSARIRPYVATPPLPQPCGEAV